MEDNESNGSDGKPCAQCGDRLAVPDTYKGRFCGHVCEADNGDCVEPSSANRPGWYA